MVKPDYKLAATQQNFKQFYEKNLRHKYQELEPARKKYIRKFQIRLAFSAAICFLVYYLCKKNIISETTYSSDFFIQLCLFAIFGMCWWCCLPFADYREETKSLVMDRILSFWGNFFYSKVPAIAENDVKKSELFCRYSYEQNDDSFQGTYQNTQIKVTEKDLRVKGNKHDYSIFKGVMILLEFNKSFSSKTVVINKGNFNAFWRGKMQIIALLMVVFGVVMTLLSMFMLSDNNLERDILAGVAAISGLLIVLYFRFYFNQRKKATQTVYLEEIKFNKNWRVLTNDQIEARCILTPVFMEKINQVRKLFKGHHIDFSFYDNKLFLAVHTNKNLFETTSLFTSALNYAKVREVVGQLHSIFSVIDLLDLHK